MEPSDLMRFAVSALDDDYFKLSEDLTALRVKFISPISTNSRAVLRSALER